MLWYLFGRASDFSLVQKQNLTIDAADIMFVRFIRLKTSEEQGLSLIPDLDFVTCPVHAIALALITQAAPCVDLLDNLPALLVQAAASLSPATPLLEVLDHPAEYAALGAAAAAAAPAEETPTRTSTGCLTGSQPTLVSRPRSIRTPFTGAERSISTGVMASRIAGSSTVAPGT
ncbi:hypothetical protein PI125_g8308 [Phytophthora idaei]|nr:hypothetical protein PI125_g8308 [Phytophthora idaei]